MKKIELLSPAGSYESGIAAIQNGCDAIYLAMGRFGARAFAHNFDDEALRKIVPYAHAYDVKVYVTLNTLIHDDEMDACLQVVSFLYEMDVDALIVQDLGLVYEIRTRFPDFEVHASTQMHVCNKQALQFLHQIGVRRAVLAREVTIDEIKRFSKLPIELEVFVHGALCVAYSGQCLMSSMVGGRSGNRGECAQTCRMPYALIDYTSKKKYQKPTYLLSLKDLNTLEHVEELKQAGISSFKIEGRMKKSEYVAHITSLYRKQLAETGAEISEAQMENAKLLFHRGFTSGFLFQQKGTHLFNPHRPNHIGIQVGKVLGHQNQKVKVKLVHDLYQHDGIRILMDKEDHGFKVNRLYEQNKLVNCAKAGSIVEIECQKFIPKGSIVVKTSDPLKEKKIRESYEHITRRIKVSMCVKAKADKPLSISMSDGINEVVAHSENPLEIAQNRATSREEIEKQCRKLNDTIFVLDGFEVMMEEELFVPIKMVNELRRQCAQKLYALRSQKIKREVVPFYTPSVVVEKQPLTLRASVLHEEQLLYVLDKVDYVYVQDSVLYEKYKYNSNVLLCAQRVQKDGYDQAMVIQDIGGLAAQSQVVCDSSLNVYNASTLRFLTLQNASSVTMSLELDRFQIENCLCRYDQIYGQAVNCEVVVYGRVEVMVSEHCPINATLLDNDKQGCQLCRKQTFALQDKFNNEYPMCNDMQCRMHLYDYKISDRILETNAYIDMGVNALRLNFTFEKENEIREVLEKLNEQLAKRN